jgi:hypothetical protein
MAAKLKTELVQLRLTPLEKEKLRVLSDLYQKTYSECIRWLIEKEPVPPK